jgi:hypothetical protein
VVVICGHTSPELRVTFSVSECSSYLNRNGNSLRDMNEIAWTLVPRGPKRAAGFVSPGAASDGEGQREIEIVLKQNQ